ncbi:hypothetical protein OJ998_22190 [Solirubrobacter taibaiensis]|nr:hypothetical protein [Solirubrobacter taibaiensis]
MRRVLLLFGALWPPIYMLGFAALVIEATIRNGGDPDNDLLIPFGVVVGVHLGTMLVILAAAIAYVVHAWKNPQLTPDNRTLWVVVLLLGAPVAMPIYWWLYVRPVSPKRERRTPATG